MSLQYSNATRFLWMHNACDYITFDSVNFIGLSSTSSAKNLIVAPNSDTSALSAANNVSHLTLKNCVLNNILLYQEAQTSLFGIRERFLELELPWTNLPPPVTYQFIYTDPSNISTDGLG